VELIERDLDLEKELEKLKGSFKHDDEVANIYNVGRKKFFIYFSFCVFFLLFKILFLLEIIELLLISL
jgi:hypothetical protein